MPQEFDGGDEAAASLDLRSLLVLLTREQAAHFWRLAAAQAKLLPHNRREHLAFCLAIQEADRDDQKTRPASALPRIPRRLSGTDLQKAVLRLKQRLLATEAGGRHLASEFCRWVQLEHKTALLAILGAMNCPCDENGTLAGSVPIFTATEAESAILALATQFDATQLALVCGALVISGQRHGAHWDGLAPVYGVLLERAAIHAQNSLTQTAQPLPVPSQSTAPVQPTPADVAPASPIAIVDCAAQASTENSMLASPMGAHSTAAPQTLRVIEACRGVVHATDPDFPGHAAIREVARALQLSLARGFVGDIDGSVMLKGAHALVRLIEFGNDLKDAEVERLDTLVQTTFGRAVAIAATRSKLKFGPDLTSATAEDDSALHEVDSKGSLAQQPEAQERLAADVSDPPAPGETCESVGEYAGDLFRDVAHRPTGAEHSLLTAPRSEPLRSRKRQPSVYAAQTHSLRRRAAPLAES